MIKYAESAENILSRLKNGITNVDTSEGSFVHDSQAPVSIEIADVKIKMDQILSRVFAKYALENGYSEELEARTDEMGIDKKDGTKATTYVTFTGVEGATYPAGAYVKTLNGLSYKVINNATIPVGAVTILAQVEAEAIGSKYNVMANSITVMPTKYNGITGVTNLDNVTNGADKESNEDLYNRYKLRIQNPQTSGNKYHYESWALEVSNVGDAKCIPLWAGNGTVKVVVINSNKRGADSTIVNNVANYIETVRPIGATVAVISAHEVPINITVDLLIDENEYTLSQVKLNVETTLTQYLQDIAFKQLYVSYAKVGNVILTSTGVSDYNNLLINGTSTNVTIGEEDVAVLGSVVVSNA
ncbi:baseplate J/gp47 family protein [Clostridium beijerinckii]|uniref:baseplate J/gp47 family protein n=1 Tax=Clostridium beijerinckii TaxID=1520 RepID=UPI001494B32D|nr:baseplate J/gp47 family protein [Clostridium beijerinckii]NOW03241.1 putative phage protein gp47/JayE [Clostridium beijerinckii]NYC03617.1 putative phage protein gp47/JayE [Clostridium beijerinckii]